MKTPIEKLITSLKDKHDNLIGVHGEEVRQEFKNGIMWSITSADAFLHEEKMQRNDLLEALRRISFTASKLWDEVKPIKDSDAMTITHPIIEETKELLRELTKIQCTCQNIGEAENCDKNCEQP